MNESYDTGSTGMDWVGLVCNDDDGGGDGDDDRCSSHSSNIGQETGRAVGGQIASRVMMIVKE